MNQINKHQDFEKVNSEFEEAKRDIYTDCASNKAWTKFTPIHKNISYNRCPICEQKLDMENERHTGSSIDHFRPKRNLANSKLPKDAYAFLECEENNYILMCKGCNDGYKESFFPLDNDFVAKSIDDLVLEYPLLINPREEDPLDYFELVFTTKYLPLAILELKRKQDLGKGSYSYRKAEKTILFFGLGKCHKLEIEKNDNNLCRVITLNEHYEALYDLAKAIQEEKDFSELLEDNPKLIEYGFFRFLIEGQFRID
ncbi:MAG: hypothetical protein Q9M39_05845 [Sulfurovum sp.]|nr:hypothetical protein [Sulfurovum sp.]